MRSPNFLVDTNVLSELARPKPNRGVLEWAGAVSCIALSVICVEELYFGLAWKPNARIQAWLDRFLEERCTILPVDAEVARRCGELRGGLQARGRPRTQADMLIAATAQVRRLTLVTRNTDDFEGCGIALLNPFV
jgi:predicted nucleic acid-binding protein